MDRNPWPSANGKPRTEPYGTLTAGPCGKDSTVLELSLIGPRELLRLMDLVVRPINDSLKLRSRKSRLGGKVDIPRSSNTQGLFSDQYTSHSLVVAYPEVPVWFRGGKSRAAGVFLS